MRLVVQLWWWKEAFLLSFTLCCNSWDSNECRLFGIWNFNDNYFLKPPENFLAFIDYRNSVLGSSHFFVSSHSIFLLNFIRSFRTKSHPWVLSYCFRLILSSLKFCILRSSQKLAVSAIWAEEALEVHSSVQKFKDCKIILSPGSSN